MKAISIDKPCSENWAAMTPSQQGAFCGKCQIDVVDFSNKSPLEVKLILQENVGKHMCGRFKKTQLDDINLDYSNWETQSLRTFQSKFVYALVVVFGMTLFSCHGPDEMIMGDIGPVEYTIPDSTSHQENFDRIELEGTFMNYGAASDSDKDSTKKVIQQDRDNVKGRVSYNYYEEDKVEEVKKDTVIPVVEAINEHEYIKGDMAYYPPDTIEIPRTNLDVDSTIEELHVLGEMTIQQDFIVGKMLMEIDTTTYKLPVIEDVNIHAIDTNTTSTVVISESNFSVRLFPNPTANLAIVAIQVSQASHFTIELFDVNGQKLAQIYDGRLSVGEQEFAVAMDIHAPGNYLVVVTEVNSTQTVKIQKVN